MWIGLGALSIVWTPAISSAQDRWTTPFPGVRYLVRHASGPREIRAVEIDLCAAGISPRATREAERRRTVPSFASTTGVEVAVNGDFFSYATYLPSGAAAGNGVAWGNADSSGEGFIAFGRDRLELSREGAVVNPLAGWMREVVGGKPMVLRAGETVPYGTRELCTTRHPRTILGLSRDRHTLYLAVVDGRSSRSIGMSCGEEAALMRGLGAYDAINLDGGGSSTMWIRGQGVVNVPSDGAPRTVSNHLGFQASGSGIPTACMPYEPEEDELAAGALQTTNTDLDGDGRPDLCARAAAGIRCALADGSAFGEVSAGPALADSSGWRDPTNFETIVMGDVTGDGLADLCARANAGVRCWPSTGVGFGDSIVGPELSDASGWGVARHYGTIRLADIDGDGDDDLCARAGVGFRCWPSNGAGFDGPTDPIVALSNDAGFSDPSRWSTIRMGDVNGDGLADVCAREATGLSCWLSTGIGFDPAAIAGPAWRDDNGWDVHRRYSTFRLADLDGDGRDDVCARGSAGLRCHLSTGDGFGPAIVLDALSDAAGFDELENYATIALADVDGDGDRDVCARADEGISCWPFEDGGFGAPIAGPTLSNASGWSRAIYWRTIRFADIDGDGDDDVCARAAAGMRCWPAQAGGFGDALEGPEWSDALSWWAPRFHTTIRLAGPRRVRAAPPPPESRGDASVPTEAPDAGVSMARADAGSAAPGSPGVTLSSGCSAAPAQRRVPTIALALFAIGALLTPAASRAGARRARSRS